MNLDEILRKMFQVTEIDWKEEIAILPNEKLAQAKSDILKWVREQLPKKKYYDKETTNNYAQYAFQGYNQAIDETEKKFK